MNNSTTDTLILHHSTVEISEVELTVYGQDRRETSRSQQYPTIITHQVPMSICAHVRNKQSQGDLLLFIIFKSEGLFFVFFISPCVFVVLTGTSDSLGT